MARKHRSNADLMTAWQTPAGQLPLDRAQDPKPMCILLMQCYCACHAAGLSASEPCDPSEQRAQCLASRDPR